MYTNVWSSSCEAGFRFGPRLRFGAGVGVGGGCAALRLARAADRVYGLLEVEAGAMEEG